MKSLIWLTAWIVPLTLASACASTPPPKALPPPSIAPPDSELMVPPNGEDLTGLLPPADERRLSDYEAAYLALLDIHVPVAVRLARLQAWTRRVTGEPAPAGEGDQRKGAP